MADPSTHPSRLQWHVAGGAAASVAPPFSNPSQLRVLFLKADANNSDGVDVDELVDIFAELGEKATQRELKALVRKFGHEEKDDFVVDFEVRDPSSDHSEGSSPTPRTQRS